jgi:hypothetical protein
MTLSATFFKLQTPRRRLIFSNMADLARTMTCLNFTSSNFLTLLHYALVTLSLHARFSVYNDNNSAQTVAVSVGESLSIVGRFNNIGDVALRIT